MDTYKGIRRLLGSIAFQVNVSISDRDQPESRSVYHRAVVGTLSIPHFPLLRCLPNQG